MNTAISTLSRFFSPHRREAELDPADMGTCFGMEMTLQRDPQPLESERVRAAADGPSSTASSSTGKRGWRPWPARVGRKAPLAA